MNTRRSAALSIEARLWIALVLATMLSTSPLPALSAGTCSGEGPGLHSFDPDESESGAGGTGLAATPRAIPLLPDDDEESGIGGTGARPHRRSDDDDNESGIGGTGLLGPIRVLDEGRGGSKPSAPRRNTGTRLCMNGLEIEVPASLALESASGRSVSSATGLVTGRMAWVEAESVDGRLVATRVLLAEDRIGWLEHVARGDGSRRTDKRPGGLNPIAQPIRHPQGMLEGVGPWVLRASGVRVYVVAETWVHRDVVGRTRPTFRPGTWIRYQGFAKNANTFYATRIDLGPKGRSVVPKKSLDERVAERLRSDPAAHPDYVSIEGYVKGTVERPEIAGLPIEMPDRAPLGARTALQPGHRARVGGRLGRDGTILPRPPPPALRPQRTPSNHPATQPRDEAREPTDDPPTPAPGKTQTPRSDTGSAHVDRPDVRPTRPVDVPARPTRIRPDRKQIVRPTVDRIR